MPYIKYKEIDTKEPTSSNIRGLYTNEPSDKQDIIEVDQRSAELWKRDPNNYAVVDQQLVTIKRPYSNLNKAESFHKERRKTQESINEPLEVQDTTYNIDQAFQNNLSLGLGIVSCDPKHKIKLWCKQDNEWLFKEHSKDELLEVAKELNKRREDNSNKLYNE